MKAISLWQPWASLMAIGAKVIETRSWCPPAELNGHDLAIHAALHFTREEQDLCFEEPFRTVLTEAGLIEPKRHTLPPTQFKLPLGAIVCVVRFDRAMPTEYITKQTDGPFYLSGREEAFGNYGPQRFGLKTSNLRRLLEPVPCRGFQKIWNLDDDVAQQVLSQLAAVSR